MGVVMSYKTYRCPKCNNTNPREFSKMNCIFGDEHRNGVDLNGAMMCGQCGESGLEKHFFNGLSEKENVMFSIRSENEK